MHAALRPFNTLRGLSRMRGLEHVKIKFRHFFTYAIHFVSHVFSLQSYQTHELGRNSSSPSPTLVRDFLTSKTSWFVIPNKLTRTLVSKLYTQICDKKLFRKRGWKPAARGLHMALATIFCGLSHNLVIGQFERGKNMGINRPIYTRKQKIIGLLITEVLYNYQCLQNQNCLTADKYSLYNKISCMEKHGYYPFPFSNKL